LRTRSQQEQRRADHEAGTDSEPCDAAPPQRACRVTHTGLRRQYVRPKPRAQSLFDARSIALARTKRSLACLDQRTSFGVEIRHQARPLWRAS
jgi:hypothetical protein